MLPALLHSERGKFHCEMVCPLENRESRTLAVLKLLANQHLQGVWQTVDAPNLFLTNDICDNVPLKYPQ